MTAAPRWRRAILSVLPLILLVSACADSPEVSKRKALERGERFLAEGKAAEAIITLRSALAVDRDFVPALHALGRAYAANGFASDAVRELARAHALAPDSTAIAADLGRSLLQEGAFAEAEATAAKILAREPGNPAGLYVRTAALLGQGKVAAAREALAAIPPGSMTPELQAVNGETLLRADDLAGAEAAFRAALAADARSATALIGLGRLALARQDFSEALGRFLEASAVRPTDPTVRLGLAEARARLGRTKEAIADLEALDPRARSLPVQLALARFYLADKRAPEAAAILGPVAEHFPRLARARVLLGHAYLATRKPDRAAVEFEAAIGLVPDEPDLQLALATALLQQGRGPEALARLDGVAKSLDKTAAFHNARAGALLLVGKLDDAVRAAEAAQRLAPRDPQPHVTIGMIRAQQGQAQVARELFARAAELDASYAPAHLGLGRLNAAERKTGAALQDFDRAVEANPQSLIAVRAKTEALVREGRAKDALAFLEAAVSRDPTSASLHVLLAVLHASLRQPDKAAASFRKAAEVDPRALEPRIGLARLAMSQENDKEAVAQLQAAVKDHPDDPVAVLLLTSLHDKLAQYDQAVPVLEAAAKGGPNQAAFSLALSEMYLKQGRYEEALARASELVKQVPAAAGPRMIRGQALLAKGDAPAAVKELAEAVRLAPKWAGARIFLARAQAAAGRPAEARVTYREAVALDPRLAGPRSARAAAPGGKASAPDRTAALQALVTAEPGNLAAREDLARALLARGQVKEAQGELAKVLERAPGRVEANLLMARVLLGQDRGEEAAGHLRAALKTNPTHIDANLLLARHLQQRGRQEEALGHVQAVLRASPQIANLQAALARVPGAMAMAQELERREPKSAGVPALVGWIALSQGGPAAAAEAFRRALRLKPDLAEAHRGLGQALELTGKTDEAIDSYRKAIAFNGNDVASLNNLAWLLSEARRRPDEALPFATRAVELLPRTGPVEMGPPAAGVWDTLGWVQHRRGQFAEAERALTRAAELAPSNAAIHFHLGSTYSRLGKKPAALQSLRRAAELSPDLARAERIPELLKDLGG